MSTNAEKAEKILADVAEVSSWSPADALAMAQVHATLALVEAIRESTPVREDDPPVDPVNTREGWSWP